MADPLDQYGRADGGEVDPLQQYALRTPRERGWWLEPRADGGAVLSYAPSEFTTAGEMMQERVLQALVPPRRPADPYSPPVSGFTTPGDERRGRLSSKLGVDVDRPWANLGARAMRELGSLPFMPRVTRTQQILQAHPERAAMIRERLQQSPETTWTIGTGQPAKVTALPDGRYSIRSSYAFKNNEGKPIRGYDTGIMSNMDDMIYALINTGYEPF